MLSKLNQNGKNEIIQLKTPVEFALEGIDKIDKYLKALDKEHNGLTIQPDNKQDYEAVRLAIKDRRELRGKIVAQHKNGKKDIIAYGKLWDEEKARIIDKIMPREIELKAEKKKEDDRIQAIKDAEAEAEEKRKADIRKVITEIQNMGTNSTTFSLDEIETAIKELNKIDPDPEIFAEFTPEALEAKENTANVLDAAHANRINLDQEKSDRKAEAERLKKERKKLADQKAKQDKKDKEQAEAQKKIDDDKAELEKIRQNIPKNIPDPEGDQKTTHPLEPGGGLHTNSIDATPQHADDSAPENKLLRRDKERIRIFAEKLQDLDVPEILDPDLIDFLDTELLNISMVAKRLLEGIE